MSWQSRKSSVIDMQLKLYNIFFNFFSFCPKPVLKMEKLFFLVTIIISVSIGNCYFQYKKDIFDLLDGYFAWSLWHFEFKNNSVSKLQWIQHLCGTKHNVLCLSIHTTILYNWHSKWLLLQYFTTWKFSMWISSSKF